MYFDKQFRGAKIRSILLKITLQICEVLNKNTNKRHFRKTICLQN